MSIIVIKDLPESLDLDREAMLAITGGARTRGRPTFLGRTKFTGIKIVQDRARRVVASTLQASTLKK
jgi:hypothetical protein